MKVIREAEKLRMEQYYGEKGLCPICGKMVSIIDETTNDRLIGSCKDAFTLKQWQSED